VELSSLLCDLSLSTLPKFREGKGRIGLCNLVWCVFRNARVGYQIRAKGRDEDRARGDMNTAT
jgi:hypothetical protein